MTITWWMGLLSGIILLLSGALLTFFQSWYRTRQRFRKQKKEQTRKLAEAALEQVKKVSVSVDQNAFLIEAISDRMAATTRATMAVATAFKHGNPEQAAKAIEIAEAGEARFLTALTNHMTKKSEVVPDAEEA